MWDLAGAVILSGLVLVFVVLCVLILVVNVTGKLSGGSKKPKDAPAPAALAAKPVPAAEAGIQEETLAVIAAAVAAMMEEESPGTAYTIAQVQRARSSRPVWGFAGMLQNTRPF